ncbi:MAG: phage terminase large subunit [Bacteroidaceae bacterium]|nr:phage terminase large subunit [Bacteroidaceae bacterium]
MSVKGLKAPENLTINITPSPKQYELWKMLQPDYCPNCGGRIIQKQIGVTNVGKPLYEPVCDTCGTNDIPQLILGGGAAGGGKATTLDTKICTPFGFKELREIKVGSVITNPITGGMQEVIALHPIETHPYYRVHFVDGTFVDCSEGHLWVCHQSRTKSKRAKYNDISNDKVWLTKDMYAWYQRKQMGSYKGRNLIIPLTQPVKFTLGCHKPKIDPYVLGALIGDGCMTDSCIQKGFVEFANEDYEIVERFIQAGYDMSRAYQRAAGQNPNLMQYAIRDKVLIQHLKDYGLAGNNSKTHYIPKEYKMASIKDRINLMQGLIDTDGYVDDRGHIIYTTISEQLAEDVAFVVRSLGGVATITKNPAGYKRPDTGEFVKCNDTYDVQIRTKMNPDLCGISRKKERARYEFNGGNSELGKRITDIEYIGMREGRCITVDDPSGLYVADNFTVTHNSYLGSCWIISSCIRFEDIRAVIARKTLKSLKESTFNTVKKICKDWGLIQDENYKINNLDGTLTFWNGSVIILKEMVFKPTDPQYERFGSSEYTIAFVDEVSEISEKAIEVLFSRLRWRTDETFKTAKMLMSTNPCLTWVRSRFVQDDDGNPVVCRQNERYVPFSVWDNPDSKFVATYVAALNKISDPLTRARLLYGEWNYVESNKMAAYWNFDGKTHLVMNLYEQKYDPLMPLIVSWDFNVAPYMSALEIQINYTEKEIYVLKELVGKPSDKLNNTPALARYEAASLVNRQHLGKVIVTGDPAGNSRSTQTEDGTTNFTILTQELKRASEILDPSVNIFQKQPPHVTRLEFINALFGGYEGWKVMIDMRCRKLTEDMIYQRKCDDGTKEKKKVFDPVAKVKCEKYGHLSDCFDYALCKFVSEPWIKYQRGTKEIQITSAPAQYSNFDF